MIQMVQSDQERLSSVTSLSAKNLSKQDVQYFLNEEIKNVEYEGSLFLCYPCELFWQMVR